ncbi:uncharacterized protein PAC_10758 [Phialocephala subalpina]|uniref:Uncharacterized protein n=1 Tax=Phialocephala subalpina TaxID=576137 RepID=A0A1L7X783_9HELO|nr:uncharacterized protein PAC_10758 [Phialocephala subalpina]
MMSNKPKNTPAYGYRQVGTRAGHGESTSLVVSPDHFEDNLEDNLKDPIEQSNHRDLPPPYDHLHTQIFTMANDEDRGRHTKRTPLLSITGLPELTTSGRLEIGANGWCTCIVVILVTLAGATFITIAVYYVWKLTRELPQNPLSL